MLSDFRVSKDRPKVTHIPTGLIWEFKRTPEGYWDGPPGLTSPTHWRSIE
jgi:hypothetical protein